MEEELRKSYKEVKLERVFPDDLESHFVTNVVIQHQEECFILSFFETWPPPVLGDTPEEIRASIDSIQKVEAKCVARLVVPPSKMRDFLSVMNENYQKYEALKAFQAGADIEG